MDLAIFGYIGCLYCYGLRLEYSNTVVCKILPLHQVAKPQLYFANRTYAELPRVKEDERKCKTTANPKE